MRKMYKRIGAFFLIAAILFIQFGSRGYAQSSYDNQGVRDFVVRLYQVVLNREPDEAGLDAWYGQLVSGGQSGAQVARDFLFSREFEEKNYSNAQYVEILYWALFDREPDAEGYGQWLAQLDAGASRLTICKGFVDSQEFADLCQNFGIVKGTIEAPSNGQQIYLVDQFVRRLYQVTLGREADSDGLESWKKLLIEGSSTGAQVVKGFVFSQECQNMNLSDEDYVRLLYASLFDREADSDGLAGWKNLLDHGLTRDYVCNGFINSDEFAALCQKYGIEKGSAVSEDIRDRNESLTVFVADMYLKGLGRGFSQSELENALNLFFNNETNGYTYVRGVVESAEFTARSVSDEVFMDFLYDTVLQADKNSGDYSRQLSALKNGTSRSDILEECLTGETFAARCQTMGIQATGRLIDPDKPMVALTFDDGPSAHTPIILDTLEQYGQVATFFVVGEWVPVYPNTVKRAYDMGCEIGSHSNTHADLATLSPSGIVSEMSITDNNLLNVTGAPATVMRPPGGSQNATVRANVGKPIIMWSLDTADWKTRDVTSTVNAVLNNVRDGDVVIMHDLHRPTALAAQIIIPELVNRGYQLVTVSELAQYRGGLEPGQVYYDFYK